MLDSSYETREFPMSQSNFAVIQKVAYELTGINLSSHKKNMIYGRLARRLRNLSLENFDQYCELISTHHSPEIRDFINAITTNLTSFFREPHHFEFLVNTVYPELIKNNIREHRIRVWSAGCSTGEEPYSIALTMMEYLPVATWNVKLLATDLDSEVLATGKSGVYSLDRIDSVSASRRQKWFLKDERYNRVRVKPSLQQLITFKQLNLLKTWPMKGPFDFIFCRNVVIYFDKDTQKRLFDRFANIMAEGGYLFIGHSESLYKVSDRFRPLGSTVYQKMN